MATHWWVFRRPLLRDPLFVLGLAVGAVGAVVTALLGGHRGAAASVLQPALAFPSGMVLVGVLGGVVREFRAGRRPRAEDRHE